MRKLVVLAAAVAALAFPSPSHAQQPSSFSLGLRLGYGFAMGDVGGTLSMGDWVGRQIPVQVDAMFKVSPQVALGAYFSYGFASASGQISDTCGISGVDCSASTWRLGAQATYSFVQASSQAVPWAGVGFGYESNSLDVKQGGDNMKTTFTGWEYLNLQGGADFKVSPNFSVGPYALLSIGQYGEGEISGSIASGSGSISDKKVHEWLSFGVRGKFDL